MSEFKAPWSWDDKVWEEYDPMQRAPWLVDATGDPVLKGEIRCVSEEFARLIEAAPELLEALQALFNAYVSIMKSEFDFPGRPWTPERDNDEDALQAIAAIAKATGES